MKNRTLSLQTKTIPKRGDIRKSLKQISLERQRVDGRDKNTWDLYKVTYFEIKQFIAIKQFGKDWKKVEDYIGTRTGA